MSNLTLHGFFRSSASYRARIGLNLKGVPYDKIAVHLTKDGGAQFQADYSALNPQNLVPTLVAEDGTRLTQSLAILEYLDELYPAPPLLPSDALGRARVRALAYLVACEMQPLNNLRVLKYLKGDLGLSDEAETTWYHHWIGLGFEALEARLAADGVEGQFCHGDTPTLADVCLVPQVFNAERFGCDLIPYPRLMAVREACEALPAFADAQPSKQPDAA